MNNENETKRKGMAKLSFITLSSVVLILIIVIIILYLRKKYILSKEKKELQRKKTIHKFSNKENINNEEHLQITSGRNKNYSHNTGVYENSSANTALGEIKSHNLK